MAEKVKVTGIAEIVKNKPEKEQYIVSIAGEWIFGNGTCPFNERDQVDLECKISRTKDRAFKWIETWKVIKKAEQQPLPQPPAQAGKEAAPSSAEQPKKYVNTSVRQTAMNCATQVAIVQFNALSEEKKAEMEIGSRGIITLAKELLPWMEGEE